jgi:hypothetical protein
MNTTPPKNPHSHPNSKPLKNNSNSHSHKNTTTTPPLPDKITKDAIAISPNAKKITASATKWETHVLKIVNVLDAKTMSLQWNTSKMKGSLWK